MRPSWRRDATPTSQRLLFAFLFLAGCASPPPFKVRSSCGGFGDGSTVFGESTELDCVLVASRLELAREILVSRDIVPAEQFDAAFGGVTIWVRGDNEPFQCEKKNEGPARNGGCYNVKTREILTTMDMETILHEMLHYWQLAVLGVDPDGPMHPGWTENGYREADVAFRRIVLNMPAR